MKLKAMLLFGMGLLIAQSLTHYSCTSKSDDRQPTMTPTAEYTVTPTAEPEPEYYTYEIVNIFPHDSEAFTQGLIYESGFLYEGTGLWGESSLRKVDLETGEVLQIVELDDQYFGEGITLFRDKIYQVTYRSRIGFIYQWDTFTQTGTFSYATEGWGLTHDGENLIMSDGTNVLKFIDPQTFEVKKSLPVMDRTKPIRYLNELEYVDGLIYANVWLTDMIAIIDPENGSVTAWINLSGLLDFIDYSGSVDVLNGIAYDTKEKRLFVTGKFWPALFEIVIKLD